MTEMELREILGPAYNPRYMSIQEPQKVTSIDEKTGLKRTIGDFAPNFYVDGDFGTNLDENDDDIALLPAWSTKYSLEDVIDYNRSREKRSPMSVSKRFKNIMGELDMISNGGSKNNNNQRARPWECESRIRWIDLGREYFPRYLRTVECLAHDCWYGHYTCKPRSFTVKMLRKRGGLCAPIKDGQDKRKIGQEGLPMDLRQLWVWEERAVTFCCDCSA
ncbi:protein trunk [Chrysoperla carnea]|uniref:protein trunk n=1 Tax=Chrysoperla carnea TaxID=189513 RepID=UPI001D08480C|nr:protein trunk [Chrysoperla carnea]